MKTTNSSQKGFAIVEIAVIVAVVALVGVLGYTYMNRQVSTSEKNTTPTAQTAKVETTNIKSELETIDIDASLDTSTIDEALQ